jgi:hypothetical protein
LATYRGELQDSLGNVLHPETEAKGVYITPIPEISGCTTSQDALNTLGNRNQQIETDINTLKTVALTGNTSTTVINSQGNATQADVLNPKTFSNGSSVNLVGSMVNNGAINKTLAINETFTIPAGYTSGGTINQFIPTRSSATINPSTVQQIISGNQYLTGDQIISPVIGTANVNDVMLGKVFSSANGINLVGQATLQSLGGKRFTSGTANTFSVNTSGSIYDYYMDISASLTFTPSVVFGYGSDGWFIATSVLGTSNAYAQQCKNNSTNPPYLFQYYGTDGCNTSTKIHVARTAGDVNMTYANWFAWE